MYALSSHLRFQLRLTEIKYFESALAFDIPSKLFFHYFFFFPTSRSSNEPRHAAALKGALFLRWSNLGAHTRGPRAC